jgi:hypothetical protein
MSALGQKRTSVKAALLSLGFDVVAEESRKRNARRDNNIPDDEANDKITDGKNIFYRPQVHIMNGAVA